MGTSWWDLLDPKTKHTIIKTGKLPQKKGKSNKVTYEKYLEGYGKDAKVKKKWVRADDDPYSLPLFKPEAIKATQEIKVTNKNNLKPLIPELSQKLKKHGYVFDSSKPLKSLKPTSFGFAFKTKDGEVLKITVDKKEAETSAKLKGKKFKNIVNIYKAFMIKGYKGVYFIHQQYLKPLTGTESVILDSAPLPPSNEISEILEFTAKLNMVNSLEELFQVEMRLSYDEDKQDLFQEFMANGGKKYPLVIGLMLKTLMDYDTAKDVRDLMPTSAKEIVILNSALKGLKEMDDKGIVYFDTHVGNIRKDPKTKELKWIDLGYGSQAPGKGKIEEIANSGRIRLNTIRKVKKLGFKILASKMMERFLTSIYIKLAAEIKNRNLKGHVKIWPSRYKIKITLNHKKDKKIRYLITLVNNSFILVAKEPEEIVFDKIENNMKEKELTSKILNSILEHFEETKDNLHIKYTLK